MAVCSVKAFALLCEKMVQSSSKSSITVSAIIFTPPKPTTPITLHKTSGRALPLAIAPVFSMGCLLRSVAIVLFSRGAIGEEIRAPSALVIPPLVR